MDISTFLMFEGRAEEAMNFYVSIFEDGEVVSIRRYGPNQGGQEGTVMNAVFKLAGREYMCIDSPAEHGFTFTPAMSLFVQCDSEQQTEELFRKLSADGSVMMPLGPYPFAKKFAWVGDKFGISWQLSFN